jgi:hypothetical protein
MFGYKTFAFSGIPEMYCVAQQNLVKDSEPRADGGVTDNTGLRHVTTCSLERTCRCFGRK